MNTKTSMTRNSISRSLLRNSFFLIGLIVAWFAPSPQARGTCQHGCLTNNNTVLGDDALINNTGDNNTAIGADALFNNTSGFFNSATGSHALFSNTTGSYNTALGNQALQFNTTGSHNTGLGEVALSANTSGGSNTAVGSAALADNVTGGGNTAVGESALIANTSGSSNTAVGSVALLFNTTGDFNTAIGVGGLETNSIGSSNVAIGFYSAQLNKRGNNNTVVGFEALRLNKHGSSNTGLGNNSLYSCQGSNNIAVGDSAGVNLRQAENNIEIGNGGLPQDINTIRIGNETHTVTYMAGISGATVPNGVGVIIDTDGHLGTVVSSERFKEAINPMDKASEAILALKPVTFRYKHELDPAGVPQFGLVAEQVEKVNPDLVACDEQGKPYTVRYEAVNAMLLNEFLKEHRKVEQHRKDFEVAIARQQKQIDVLTAALQKVSAELDLSMSAPQTVQNRQ
jgi:trimeric autotransporter adhesin